MAADLIPISIAAPGFFGLNTQDSPIGLPAEYALEANNCIIDRLGRIGARKGRTAVGVAPGIGTSDVTLVHEFIGADSTVRYLFIAAGDIYEMESDGTCTSVYTGAWTGAGTYAGDSGWKAVTFNGYVWFFKRGENPLRYTPGTFSPYVVGTVQLITAVTSPTAYAGTVQTANEVLSAYGRLWTADTATNNYTVWYSDALSGHIWTGGSSGSLDLRTVFPNGTRPIVALAAFNGYLVVFCDTVIAIYEGAETTPASTLALVDIIDGVGCISRDSIQDVGSDIFFLSDTGIRSLGRIISEKSAPIFDVSRNVRDDLIQDIILNGDNEEVKSCYNDLEGFYLLTLINQNKTYCLDLKNRLENNVCRVTAWTTAPLCYTVTKDKQMFMGYPGNVYKYDGYRDDTLSYRFSYKTSWLSGENQVALKILKNVRIISVGGAGYTLTLNWGFDYAGLPRSLQKTIGSVAAVSEWNVAEWNVGEWGSVSTISTLRAPLGGAGQVFQFNIDTPIYDQSLSIQQIDIFIKIGRLA